MLEQIWQQSEEINPQGAVKEGARVLEIEDQWTGQEHTTYSLGKFGNASEGKAELEKKRDQLKMEMDCFDKKGVFSELQGLQDKRKADDYQAVCERIQERRPLTIRITYSPVSQNTMANCTEKQQAWEEHTSPT